MSESLSPKNLSTWDIKAQKISFRLQLNLLEQNFTDENSIL